MVDKVHRALLDTGEMYTSEEVLECMETYVKLGTTVKGSKLSRELVYEYLENAIPEMGTRDLIDIFDDMTKELIWEENPSSKE